MKAKRVCVLVFAISISAWLLVGCGHEEGHGHEHAAGEANAEIDVPSFSEKSGLFLPEITRSSLDLKLAGITEQQIETVIPLSLRVYQADSERVFVTGVLAPEQSNLLTPGQSIEAKLADGTVVHGSISAIRTGMRAATGSDELLGEISSQSHTFSVGDFIPAGVRTVSESSVVAIPRRALLHNSEGEFVYTVSGEHFVRTAVTTGVTNDEFVEITDGLYAGDEVVLQPVLSLWLTELAAVKGGQACCLTPPKGK